MLVCLVTAASAVAQTAPAPFGGAPWPIPGLIQAEDYDVGGEGVAYHDMDAANEGGAYRQDGVDVGRSSEGGHYVGWFRSGEWLAYTVNVTRAGVQTMRVVMGPQHNMEFNWVTVALWAAGPHAAAPPLPTERTPSTPITATTGQVIRGVKISSTTGPCVIVDNVANVWIHDVELGPCAGNGIRITGAGAMNIRVTNSLIHTERRGPSDSGVGVFIAGGASGILVQGNQFAYNESSVYALQASTIRIIGNSSLNPLGPFPRGQHVQFNKVTGGEISDNYAESRTTNVVHQPKQEDAINLYETSRITVLRNYLVGGDSPSGCGIITDGGGPSSDNLIEGNVIIRTAQCGIGMASGNNNVIRANKVLDTNIPNGLGNIGLYVNNYSAAPCSGAQILNNIISNRLPNGSYNDYWNGGTCGAVIYTGNITGDAARALLAPEAEKLPPPPMPPKRYVPPP